MSRRQQTRRMNPRAWDPIEHNATMRRRKAVRRFSREARRSFRVMAQAFRLMSDAMNKAAASVSDLSQALNQEGRPDGNQ